MSVKLGYMDLYNENGSLFACKWTNEIMIFSLQGCDALVFLIFVFVEAIRVIALPSNA